MRNLLTALALLPQVAHAEPPSFTEETATAGVSQIFAGDWEYMVGGGASTFDCNADNRPDLILAGGTNPAKLFTNQSPKGGALSFTETQSGLELTGVLALQAFWALVLLGAGRLMLARAVRKEVVEGG